MSIGITLKNVPDDMMTRFREIAVENHRSVSGEIMYRLKKSLEHDALSPNEPTVKEEAGIIADEWEKIGGNWESDMSTEDEIETLYEHRSSGRGNDLTW